MTATRAARIGSWATALGGGLALVAFFVIPVLVGGTGGSRTGRQVAVSGDLPSLCWLFPVAAGVLFLLGTQRGSIPAKRSACIVACVAVLGHVVALTLLRRPVGAAQAYAAGIDPAGGVGPGYWVSIACLVVALAGSAPGVLSLRSRPFIAGAVVGVALGTVIASVVLDVQSRREVVLLAAEGLHEAAFGPDFAAAEPAAEAPAHVDGGTAAGDSDLLYGGTFGQPSCARDKIAEFVADASPARSGSWLFAVTNDSPEPRPDDARRYVTELTPVRLRADVLVTAHGFAGDRAYPYQSTLQAGTAVLVDRRGIPRVRCAGAVPLGPPRRPADNAGYRGPRWSGFDSAALITVTPATHDVRQFGMTGDSRSFRRPAGTDGSRDVSLEPAQALIDGTY